MGQRQARERRKGRRQWQRTAGQSCIGIYKHRARNRDHRNKINKRRETTLTPSRWMRCRGAARAVRVLAGGVRRCRSMRARGGELGSPPDEGQHRKTAEELPRSRDRGADSPVLWSPPITARLSPPPLPPRYVAAARRRTGRTGAGTAPPTGCIGLPAPPICSLGRPHYRWPPGCRQ